MEQVSYQTFKVQGALQYPAHESVLSLSYLFRCGMKGYLYAGIALFAAAIAVTIFLHVRKKTDGTVSGEMMSSLVVAFLGAVAMCLFLTSHWIWNTFQKVLDPIQFSARVFPHITALCIIVISIAAACLYRALPHRICKGAVYLFLAGLCIYLTHAAITAGENMYGREERLRIEEDFLEEYAGTGNGQEWLPLDTELGQLQEPQKGLAPDGDGADGIKHDYGKTFDVWVDVSKVYYSMPYVYYKGYHAYELDENNRIVGEELHVEKSDYNGLVRVDVPDRETETGYLHLLVRYEMTLIQKVSYLISALALVLICVKVTRGGF